MSETRHTVELRVTESRPMDGFTWRLVTAGEGEIPVAGVWNAEDADRLALAWNCHDALLAACKALDQWFDCYAEEKPSNETLNLLFHAIEKAEGRKG